jgi:hypothetical protein
MADPTSAYNPTTNYFEQMKKLQSQQSNVSYDDISSRANELSALMPQSKGRGLYGMATDLSKGFLASANSRTPFGTGLAMGFNLYSDAADLRKEKEQELRSKLMQMAYQDVQARRAETRAFTEKMLDANFKYELEMLKQTGGYFDSKTLEAQAYNDLLRGEVDPEFKKSAKYRLSWRISNEPKSVPTRTEDGVVNVVTPAPYLGDIFSQPGDNTPPPGSVFTGKADQYGRSIFQRTDQNNIPIVGDYFVKP